MNGTIAQSGMSDTIADLAVLDEIQHLVSKSKTDLAEPYSRMFDAWHRCIARGGKILFFGNGGSAATALHLAAELVVRCDRTRMPIAGMSLAADTAVLTAAGNDLGFGEIFSRQIGALGRRDDLAVGFSASGESENVLKALIEARHKGIATAAFTGANSTSFAAVADVILAVPSVHPGRIQEMHLILGHLLCSQLETLAGAA